MNGWMLPALPWLVTLHWTTLWWHSALQAGAPSEPRHSATIIPFVPRNRRGRAAG